MPKAALLDRFLYPDTESVERRVDTYESTRRVWPVYSLPCGPVSGQAVVSGVAIYVTSGTYIDTWHAQVPALIGPCLDIGIFLQTPEAGQVAEVRAQVAHPDGTVVSGSVVTAAAVGGEFHALTAHWLHGQRLHVGPVVISYQIRRLVGVLGIYIYLPARSIVRDPETASSLPSWSQITF